MEGTDGCGGGNGDGGGDGGGGFYAQICKLRTKCPSYQSDKQTKILGHTPPRSEFLQKSNHIGTGSFLQTRILTRVKSD